MTGTIAATIIATVASGGRNAADSRVVNSATMSAGASSAGDTLRPEAGTFPLDW